MKATVIKNALVLTGKGSRFTCVWTQSGRIVALSDNMPDSLSQLEIEEFDADGLTLSPGFFDLQVNGSKSCNLWADPERKDVLALAKEQALRGTTAFLPTLITDETEHLKKNVKFLTELGVGPAQVKADFQSQQLAIHPNWLSPGQDGARMPGLHLEGPCLSPSKPGVHPAQFLQPLSKDYLASIVSPAVKLVTLAPETEINGNNSIEYLLGQGITVSLGHSNANMQEAKVAFERGVSLVTHTFNALPSIHHRNPGAIVSAFLDSNVYCCMIADGLHIDPAMAALILKIKGVDKVVLVSDKAFVGTDNGELVGSSIDIVDAVTNLVSWKICSFEQAITMSSYNPALALGLDSHIGQIEPGCFADMILWDRPSLQIKRVFMNGCPI